MELSEFKIAPHSKEGEMMVLGSMLTNADSHKYTAERLKDEDFFFKEHKIIFKTMKAFSASKRQADVHIVCEELKRLGQLSAVGGPQYIVTLAQFAGTSANIEEYCEIVGEKSKLRKIIQFSEDLKKGALNNGESTKILTEFYDQSRRIQQSQSLKEKFPFKYLDQHDQNFLFDKPNPKPMLIDSLDQNGYRQGFLPKSVVGMLAGPGGVGKTHLLAQLALTIVTGTPWLGVYNTTEHCGPEKRGSVFLGFGENHYEDIHRILHKASIKLREQESGRRLLEDALKRLMPFSFCGQQAAFLDGGKPSSYFCEFKYRMCEAAPKGGWSLVILDPVSRLLGSDAESDNASATQFIALLEELSLELPGNPTILFAHHVTKAAINQKENQNQSAARGASALTDGCRWQVNFFKSDQPGEYSLKMVKTNFTAQAETIKVEKDQCGILKQMQREYVA